MTKSQLEFVKSLGFNITPIYLSKSGTSQICRTVQGWKITRSDSKRANWLDSICNWYSSKAKAVQEITDWYNAAHGTGTNLEGVRTQYLEFLKHHWPTSEAVAREFSRRKSEDIQRANEKEIKEKARIRLEKLHKAAPELLETVRAFVRQNPTCGHGVTSCGECPTCIGSRLLDQLDKE